MPEKTKSDVLDLTRPGIIEASAGTGKTFAIAEIFLALLRGEKTFPRREGAGTPAGDFSAPRAKEILVVSFSEAATAELKARLRKKIRAALSGPARETDPTRRDALMLADAEFDEAPVFTIHGFCLRALKEFGVARSRTGEVRGDVGEELFRFAVRRRARRIAAGEEIWHSASPETICGVVSLFLKNPNRVPVPPPPEDALGNALFRVVREDVPAWNALRENARDIDYGEMLTTLAAALRESPGLAARIAARYKVAIVDEFQDTDPVQWEIFRRIFLDHDKPIFCVGDPKQAIYEFRGGDVRTYRAAREEIRKKSGGNALALGKNWRSSPAMIDAFNEIFAFDEKISGEINAGAHKRKREILAGLGGLLEYAPVAFPQERASEFPEKSGAAAAPAAVLRLFGEESSKERAKNAVGERAAADIVELVRGRGVPAGKIAVLVSDNAEANFYRNALTRAGVPVSTTARGNVLCEPVAGALSDVVRAMLDPQDSARFRRALLSPFFGEEREKILLGGNDEAAAEEERLRRAFAEARAHWDHEGFLPAFRRLADALGFFRALSARPDAEKLVTDVRHLVELIHAAERGRSISPRTLADDFATKIANADPRDDSDELQLRSESDRDAVHVLTVHKSKGLEFDVVFVPSLWARSLGPGNAEIVKGETEDGRAAVFFSTEKDKSDDFVRAAVETECATSACLFYVALTRARSRLVLFHMMQIPRGTVWNSYQKLLLETCGVTAGADAEPLRRWRILHGNAELPEDVFPKNPRGTEAEDADARDALISPEEAELRFAAGENALRKISRETEGVFSFSALAKSAENSDDESGDDEPDADEDGDALPETATPRTDAPGAETLFPKRPFFDLPSGKEFGDVVHDVFEQVDFRSRENLDALLDSALPKLPQWTRKSADEKKSLRERFRALVESNLSLPLPPRGIRLETLAPRDLLRETEFNFPLKPVKNFYAGLHRIFSGWGGIYAETAERLRNAGGNAAGVEKNIAGMMNGFIDLAFRADGRFYILDWKTNSVVSRKNAPEGNFLLPASAIREEIVKHAYALQWSIYALALKKYMSRCLGDAYDHDRDFGGIVYLFVRWNAPYVDSETLTAERLDELEAFLGQTETAGTASIVEN